MNDPYTLTPDRAAEPELGAQPDIRWRRGREIAPELDGYWIGAFVMAVANTRIVRRSNALLDYAYGRRFEYAEQMSMGRRSSRPRRRRWRPSATPRRWRSAAATSTGCRASWSSASPPKPGTGPSERAREQGHYKVETYTTTTTGARYRATMAQQGDPGYKATAVLLGESGLALALDRDRLSDLRGVLTPAAAMGDALLARLPAAGVTLETARLN